MDFLDLKARFVYFFREHKEDILNVIKGLLLPLCIPVLIVISIVNELYDWHVYRYKDWCWKHGYTFDDRLDPKRQIREYRKDYRRKKREYRNNKIIDIKEELISK